MIELNCVDPGAIQDWELEAYADGDAFPHVMEHLSRCPACCARLAEDLTVERHLHQALCRFDCPSPDTLRDFYWGHLSAEQQRQLESHLDWCPHCAAELADLAEFVAMERAESSDTLLVKARQAASRARLVVAQLISPGLQPMPVLRGETREVLLFDAGDVALSVNLEQEDTGAYTLFGQVLSPPMTTYPGGYVRLTVYEGVEETKETTASAQASLDVNGSFELPSLHPGVYQLVVSLSDRRIVVPTLALRMEP